MLGNGLRRCGTFVALGAVVNDRAATDGSDGRTGSEHRDGRNKRVTGKAGVEHRESQDEPGTGDSGIDASGIADGLGRLIDAAMGGALATSGTRPRPTPGRLLAWKKKVTCQPKVETRPTARQAWRYCTSTAFLLG